MQNILKGGRRVLIGIIIAYAVVMIIGVAFMVLINEDRATLEFLGTIFELGLWFALPLLIVTLLLRAWRLSVVMAIISIAFGTFYAPYFTPEAVALGDDVPQINVLTFNTQMTRDGLRDVIVSADADIVALQELSPEGADILALLEDEYPHQALHPQMDANEGQGIISRYPIVADEYWEYPDLPHTLGHQRVEIDYDGTIITIYNTHPWPPAAFKTGFNDESHRVALRDVIERARQEEGPLLLVGDLNMSNEFNEYDLLAEHFTDSFRVAGLGTGYTFPNFSLEPIPPVLRLDYIWHTDHFATLDSQVWYEHGFSDHSPVWSQLALVNED